MWINLFGGTVWWLLLRIMHFNMSHKHLHIRSDKNLFVRMFSQSYRFSSCPRLSNQYLLNFPFSLIFRHNQRQQYFDQRNNRNISWSDNNFSDCRVDSLEHLHNGEDQEIYKSANEKVRIAHWCSLSRLIMIFVLILVWFFLVVHEINI